MGDSSGEGFGKPPDLIKPECINLPIPALRPGPKKTLSNYKGAKGNVGARIGASGMRKPLWAGEIIALEFSEIVDFRATIARAAARDYNELVPFATTSKETKQRFLTPFPSLFLLNRASRI